MSIYLKKCLSIYEINKNKLRVAHFLSQACCETADFLYLKEVTDVREYDFGTKIGKGPVNALQGDTQFKLHIEPDEEVVICCAADEQCFYVRCKGNPSLSINLRHDLQFAAR